MVLRDRPVKTVADLNGKLVASVGASAAADAAIRARLCQVRPRG
jgi:hypothetical protein